MQVSRVLPAIAPRFAAALLLSAAGLIGLDLAGPAATAVALYVLLTLFFFAVVGLLLAIPARRQADDGFGRAGPGRGGDGGWRGPDTGVREPRRPFPPRNPPRAVAIEPGDEGAL